MITYWMLLSMLFIINLINDNIKEVYSSVQSSSKLNFS